MIVPCDAPFRVLSIVQQASSLFELRSQLSLCSVVSKREGTVLHLFNDLHIYHINCISLLTTFGKPDFNQYLRKARAVRYYTPSLSGWLWRNQ